MSLSFPKHAFAKYKISVEWAGQLPAGATIVSCAVSAVDRRDQSDVSATVLQSTTGEVVGTQTKVIVKAGTPGHSYDIIFKITMDDNSLDQENVIMLVS